MKTSKEKPIGTRLPDLTVAQPRLAGASESDPSSVGSSPIQPDVPLSDSFSDEESVVSDGDEDAPLPVSTEAGGAVSDPDGGSSSPLDTVPESSSLDAVPESLAMVPESRSSEPVSSSVASVPSQGNENVSVVSKTTEAAAS